MLFKSVLQLIFNICLVTDLLVSDGCSLIRLLSKGILVEVISFKGSRNLVVKASLFKGGFRLTWLWRLN